MHYIEFMGLPGSGKSTITSKLSYKNKSFKTIDNTYVRSLCVHLFNTCFKYADKFGTLIKAIYRLVDGNHGFNIHTIRCSDHIQYLSKYIKLYASRHKRISYLYQKMYHFIEKYSMVWLYDTSSSPVIVDEGFCHGALSVFCSPFETQKAEDEHLHDYLSSIPIPDQLVFLDASVNTCKKRIKNRGRVDDNEFINMGIKKYLEAADHILKKVHQYLKDITGCEIIHINAEKDVQSTMESIERELH